jgi:hypothetical protein
MKVFAEGFQKRKAASKFPNGVEGNNDIRKLVQLLMNQAM